MKINLKYIKTKKTIRKINKIKKSPINLILIKKMKKNNCKKICKKYLKTLL